MFRGDYESGGDAVCMRSKDLTFEKRLQESLTKNMAPVIATYLKRLSFLVMTSSTYLPLC